MTPEIPAASLLVAAADAPLQVLMLWMLHLLRRELTAPGRGAEAQRPAPPAEEAGARAREELAAFKLEVARTYVPLSVIRDLDTRLSLQLVRIEEKLEEVSRAATAAAVASGQAGPRGRRGFEDARS